MDEVGELEALEAVLETLGVPPHPLKTKVERATNKKLHFFIIFPLVYTHSIEPQACFQSS